MKTKFRQKLSCMLVLGAVLALGGQAANAATTVPHLKFTLATPAPAASGATDTWSTAASKVLGVNLLAQLDSSGPAVWDAAAHPLVYVTTQGPGYFSASTMSATQKAPGIAIFDANTYEPVASTAYHNASTGGATNEAAGYSENHGVGDAAAANGINTVTTKLLAFALGATTSGLAGVFNASKLTIVSHDQFLFTVSFTVLVFGMNIISSGVLSKLAVQGVSRMMDKGLGAAFGVVEAALIASA